VALAASVDRHLASREGWSRPDLLAYQQERLTAMVRHAVERSPFYRELYGALPPGPVQLEQLPVVDKMLLMDNFDRWVTDPTLSLDRLQRHLQASDGAEHFGDSYHVLGTAGSTGLRGVFAFACAEWATVLASRMRCNRFMEIERGPGDGLRFASIASMNPFHASHRVVAGLTMGFPRPLNLDVLAPIRELVEALNRFLPEMVLAYPSVARILAGEQLEGRLRIQPRVIVTAAEWRTEEARRAIVDAWGIVPFDDYQTTEGPIGMDCSRHEGIHVFEDIGIIEVVDDMQRPVPAGRRGHKMLFTNLFNYTQPVIRYEVSDLLTLAGDPCPCGRPFSRIQAIEGRLSDMLELDALDGGTAWVHANQFEEAIQDVAGTRQFRVIEWPDRIDVLVVSTGAVADDALERSILTSLRASLDSTGVACPSMQVHIVEEIRGDPHSMGKIKIVESRKPRARS
jgi:phenylacetate-CoA ligase